MHDHGAVDLREGLGGARGAGEHAALAGDERRPPLFTGVEQRGRDVAEWTEILGERASDRVADDAGTDVAHRSTKRTRIVSSSLGKSDRV